jgi:3-carboxy-cis,cis-muconate cycloisomerase
VPDGQPDAGLLAPVWAGSAAHAATGDAALVRAMLDAEAALTRALARTGDAPPAAADAVRRVAAATVLDPVALARAATAGGNPVIPLVKALRAAVRAAEPGAEEWVHRGTTSQDVLDTALMTLSARVLDTSVLPALDAAAGAAAALADRHRRTVIAGRTLTQHAVPVSFGGKAAGWLSGLLDARRRCAEVRAALPAQLGGAAGTLAALDVPDRVAVLEAFAAGCGLAARDTPWHTVRTPVAELAAALALATGACGKAALDVTVLAQTELAEVAGDPGGESSAMPQKRNPVTAALVVSAARQAPAQLAALHLALLAENERPAGAWHAEWQPWRELLRLAGGACEATARLLGELRPDPAAMAAAVRADPALLAERLAGVLRAELGSEAAARVREAALAGLLPELLAEHGVDDPAGYLGAAPQFVDRVLARYRETTEREETEDGA